MRPAVFPLHTCGLAKTIGDIGNLTPKRKRKICFQYVALIALLGGACAFTAYRLSDSDAQNEDITKLAADGASLSRRLYAVCDGNTACNMSGCLGNGTSCSTDSCTSQDCDGECVTSAVQSDWDKLHQQFWLIDYKELKNPDRPQLRHTKPAEIVYHFTWYFLGILYMFTALAIVCDEFFVPALECFVDEFQISMDVAGATFMAAGGSMPELFTSFIGTFQENEVGFAAIVGSAVFNVLFVIAVCAIASKETLALTWWPLARDCSCYLVALLTVGFVFRFNSENEIYEWEAILLLAEYVGYCSFMKKNHEVQEWVESKLAKLSGQPDSPKPERIKSRSHSSDIEGRNVNFMKPSTFRKGIVQLLTQNTYIYETAGIAAVTQIAGDLDETFRKLDKDHDGTLSMDEIKELLKILGCKTDNTSVRTALRRINRTGEDVVTFEAFKKWYLASEARIEVEISRIFNELDSNKNGLVEKDEIAVLLKKLGHNCNPDELDDLWADLTTKPKQDKDKDTEAIAKNHNNSSERLHTPKSLSSDSPGTNNKVTELRDTASGSMEAGEPEAPPLPQEMPSPESPGEEAAPKEEVDGITEEQFESWYIGTLFYNEKQRRQKLEVEEGDGSLSLDMPDDLSWAGLAWYIWTYPLCAMMYCTLPDVRCERLQRNWRMAVLEFVLSLVWIGIFSLFLYECILVCSNTVGIPIAVSAITFLAAGTSIPDLISSYIVARNGEGDMAVSSSIGSNIFDVTVGLPLPWLCYCAIHSLNKGERVHVTVISDSLGFSLMVLIFMLIAVIGTIMICKWRLTKCLGYIMLLLYVIFVAQDLLNQLPENGANGNNSGFYDPDF